MSLKRAVMMLDLDQSLLTPFRGNVDPTYAHRAGRRPTRIARQESELDPIVSETGEDLCRTSVPRVFRKTECPARPLDQLHEGELSGAIYCDVEVALALGGLKLGDADIENADQP